MRHAVYEIQMDGQPVTLLIDPILLSMSINLNDSDEADSLELELDDTGGQIALPNVGSPVSATLYWSDSGQGVQFEGFIDEPKSGGTHHRSGRASSAASRMIMSTGSRSSGRTLTVSAKSANVNGKLKERQSKHFDKMAFGDVANHVFGQAGLTARVAGALSSVQRAYWGIFNENPMLWGTRMARELGATFKIFGNTAVFVPRSAGQSYDGKALTGIAATWGINLIQWSIAPVVSRPAAKTFKARFYDPQKAEHATAKKSKADSGSADEGSSEDLEDVEPFKSPDQDHAEAVAGSNEAESEREGGSGDTVTIDGEPAAQPEAPCTVVGIRPGVDGSYTIARVSHSLVRGGGFTTALTLKKPSGDAGKDTRTGTNQPAAPLALTEQEKALPSSSEA